MENILVVLGFFLLIMVRIAIRYVLVPLLLVMVLGFFGITISFFMAVGTCLLTYFIIMLIKA